MSKLAPTFEAWAQPPVPGELRLIPIGGLGEFGMNALAIHTSETLLLVDCGQLFPSDDQPGIDSIVPDFAYLEPFADQLEAVLITHGHEDHIGALPYFLERFDVPVYGPAFALALLEAKLKEFEDRVGDAELRVVEDFGTRSFRSGIRVEWIPVTHSIPDACALAIHTPQGTLVHTGDFKLDETPVDGRAYGRQRLEALGREGVTFLLSDSTNVHRKGWSVSESGCEAGLRAAFEETYGTLFVGTFSSHIHRIQTLLNLAYEEGRKVCLAGRSLDRAVGVGLRLGSLKLPDDILIEPRDVSLFPREQVLVLCTGTQGEEMSALSRIVRGEFRGIKMHPGDRLVMSSRTIPGNEVSVVRLLDQAARLGVETENDELGHVHVSGHALRDECAEMIRMVKPRHMVPVHGLYRNLLSHGRLAQEMGIPPERTWLLEGGHCLQVLPDGKVRWAGSVPVGRCFVDQGVAHLVDARVLHDRLIMQEDGIVVATLLVDPGTLELVAEPTILSRGFVVLSEDEPYNALLRATVLKAFETAPREIRGNRDLLVELLRQELRRVIRKTTQNRPMVVPVILEAPEG